MIKFKYSKDSLTVKLCSLYKSKDYTDHKVAKALNLSTCMNDLIETPDRTASLMWRLWWRHMFGSYHCITADGGDSSSQLHQLSIKVRASKPQKIETSRV